jgi:hypothetical protein
MLVGVFVGFFVGIFIVGFFVGFFVGISIVGIFVGFFVVGVFVGLVLVGVFVGFVVGIFIVGFFVGFVVCTSLPNTNGKKGVVRFDTGPLTMPSPHSTFLPLTRLVQSASTVPSAQKLQLLQAVILSSKPISPASHSVAGARSSQLTYVSMPAAAPFV